MSAKKRSGRPVHETITYAPDRRPYGAGKGARSRRARIVFVGVGEHALSNLYPCIPRIGAIDLVGVCDLEEMRAREAARNYGGRAWYTDAEEMLDKEKPDGAIVVGPPQMECEIGAMALARGIPLFAEKPVGLTPGDCARLVRIAKRHNTWGQVGYNHRHSVNYRVAQRVAAREAFGGVRQLMMKFSSGKYPPDLWGIHDPVLSPLVGHECHIFDLARFFAGDVAEVCAYTHELSPEQTAISAAARFVGGAVGTIACNSLEDWDSFDEYVSISGAGHYIAVDQWQHLRYHRPRSWVKLPGYAVQNTSWNIRPNGRTPLKTEDVLGYRFELEHFARCILSGHGASPGLLDAQRALEFAYAAHKSARTGRPVKLSSGRE